MASTVSPARRRASLLVLCVLAPLLAFFGWRAQGQWRDFEQAQQLFKDANGLMCGGRTPEAVPLLLKSLELCPDLVSSWDALAICHLEMRHEDQAIAVLLDARTRFPHTFLIEKSLGFAYRQKKMFKEAAQSFDEASKLDKTDPGAGFLRDGCLKQAQAQESQRTAN